MHKFAYICQWCGKEAFYTDTKPNSGETIRASDFFLPNGKQPLENAEVICPLCDTPLPTMFAENIVPVNKYHHLHP